MVAIPCSEQLAEAQPSPNFRLPVQLTTEAVLVPPKRTPFWGSSKATHIPRASLSWAAPPCLSFPTRKTKPVVISQQEKLDPAPYRHSH